MVVLQGMDHAEARMFGAGTAADMRQPGFYDQPRRACDEPDRFHCVTPRHRHAAADRT
jgi:hypothetical protein